VSDLVRVMGIEIVEASAARVVGTMPVKGNTEQDGALHGGAACVLAETLGAAGAALHAGPDRRVAVIELNVTHHATVAEGHVTGVATLLRGGRSLAGYEIVISDERDRRICTARLTCMLHGRF
jgi:1,4-dihydroxy-2-naphthoyl-CoA hydrolase